MAGALLSCLQEKCSFCPTVVSFTFPSSLKKKWFLTHGRQVIFWSEESQYIQHLADILQTCSSILESSQYVFVVLNTNVTSVVFLQQRQKSCYLGLLVLSASFTVCFYYSPLIYFFVTSQIKPKPPGTPRPSCATVFDVGTSQFFFCPSSSDHSHLSSNSILLLPSGTGRIGTHGATTREQRAPPTLSEKPVYAGCPL